MVHTVTTATIVGLDAVLVEVEADVANGLPATIIVGLPGTAVQESRERVKGAIRHSCCSYPQTKVSLNLAPADVPKNGTHFDLAIAVAILQASQQLKCTTEHRVFIGELSLDGRVRGARGVLAMALAAQTAGYAEIFVPVENAAEASLVSGITVYAVSNLISLLQHLRKEILLESVVLSTYVDTAKQTTHIDFADIAGQELAKRAIEISAAGSHAIRFTGPPGSGKTMLAKAMAGVLPQLTILESLELTKIYSIAGILKQSILKERPVRSPHHTTSSIALIGGGAVPRPGEITLAHRGVLFLDEFPEFPRSVLEVLRQPLEDGIVTVSRAKHTFTFPAQFMLVAAQNPCPCGNAGDPQLQCKCTVQEIQKYQKRVSGPLLDRIDLHVTVPRLDYETMRKRVGLVSSATIRDRVQMARDVQTQRLGNGRTNALLNKAELEQYCELDSATHQLLAHATRKYLLSGRAITRVTKVARTIADLAGSEQIQKAHIAEALQFRHKE